MTDKLVAERYLSKIDRAKINGVDFDLSFNEFKALMNIKKCQITGKVFTTHGDNAISLDRLDNYKGYIKSNVIACTKRINTLKGNLTPSEIKAIYKLLLKQKLV